MSAIRIVSDFMKETHFYKHLLFFSVRYNLIMTVNSVLCSDTLLRDYQCFLSMMTKTMTKMTKTFRIIVDKTKAKTKIKTRRKRNRNQQYFSLDNIDEISEAKIGT